jgi:polysaccharide biosynthesis transport protein
MNDRNALQPGSASPLRDPLAELRKLAAIVKRRRKVFAIAAGAMAALTILLVFSAPKSYTTEARVIAGTGGRQPSQGDAPTNLPILNALMVVSGIQSGETYAELLTEAPVAQQVIDNLHLKATASSLLAHMKVQPVNNTSIIQIAATWSDPKTSANIANEFANVFIERERDLVAGQADTAIRFLSAEMPASAERQRTSEMALSRFQESHQIADMTSQTQATVTALSSGDAKAAQLQLDRRQATAQLSSAVSQLAGMSASASGSQTLSPNPVVVTLQTQLSQVETQLGTARKTYTEKHPVVTALEAQELQIRREIAAQPATVVSGTSTVPNPVYQQLSQQAAGYRAQIAADVAGLAEVAKQRKALLAQIKSLPEETVAFAELQRGAKQAEAVYAALQQRMSDAMVAKSTAISDVTITQEASAADAVSRPSRSTALVIGLLASLILACTLVALLEVIDKRARSEEEIRMRFGRHILGALPDLGAADAETRPWLRAMALESLLQVVRSLQYASERRLRSIAFTSPGEGDGKTTVALNVARTLAELDARVLLVDGDLRRPALHKLLNVKNQSGLADVLSGASTLEQSVRTTSIPGLDLLTSGLPVIAPARALQSGDFDRLLLDAAKLHYRTVIVDLPAALPVVDAAILAEKVDGTVLVVSACATDGDAAGETVAYLERNGVKNLVGIVVNRVRREDGGVRTYYLSTSGAPLAMP